MDADEGLVAGLLFTVEGGLDGVAGGLDVLCGLTPVL